MERLPWLVPGPSLLQIKIPAFDMFYKHKLKKKTNYRAFYGNTVVAKLHLSRTTWRYKGAVPAEAIHCFNEDLRSSRAPQHSKREPRLVGPCPCHKHPNWATQPWCLAFSPPLIPWAVHSPHSPANTEAGTNLSGPCTAWHQRTPKLSLLTGWHHASRYPPHFPSS